MELEKIREIIRRLPTQSHIVEVYYRNQYGNFEARPGYLSSVMNTPFAEIPEMWRGNFGEGKEHPEPPYQCPKDCLEIRIEDIEEIRPLCICNLK